MAENVGTCVVVWRKRPGHAPLVLAVDGVKGLGLPGGKRNRGETVVQTAFRELEEETGVRLVDRGILQVRTLPKRPTDNGDLCYGFAVRAEHVEGELRASHEGRPVWVEPWALVHDRRARFPNYNAWVFGPEGVDFGPWPNRRTFEVAAQHIAESLTPKERAVLRARFPDTSYDEGSLIDAPDDALSPR